MTEIKDSFFPKKAKELLDKLRTKQIPMNEFLSECAYWGVQYIDQYRMKPMPTKPQEVVEYWDRVKTNANYEARPEFWRVPHIAAYVEQARKVDGENRGNRGKLRLILEGLPKEDNVSRGKVIAMIREYQSEYGVQIVEEVRQMDMEQITQEFFDKG